MENMFAQPETTQADEGQSTQPQWKPVTVGEDEKVIDEAFVIRETRYGLFTAYLLSGRPMSTGGTYDAALVMTRWTLQCEQEGWPEGSVRVVGSAIVGGKL